MISPELVARIGPIDTICCHDDFDGLASAAKWIRGGHEPYPGCDADARCIDTRIGEPSALASTMDRALRARPKDQQLRVRIVRVLASGTPSPTDLQELRSIAAELLPIERDTRLAASRYQLLAPSVAAVDVTDGSTTLDKTLLLLLGQELAAVAVVVDRNTVSVATRFDSGANFLTLFGVTGGMPTRVALSRADLPRVLGLLGVPTEAAARFAAR